MSVIHLKREDFDEAEALASEVIIALRATPSVEAAEQIHAMESVMDLWVHLLDPSVC